MACWQPSMSNELGGRPPTSEKAGQRLMPDRQFPLTIKRLGQLWILIRCSMPGELTAATRAGVINWGNVAPNSGLRAPKAAKPRGGTEARRARSHGPPRRLYLGQPIDFLRVAFPCRALRLRNAFAPSCCPTWMRPIPLRAISLG